MGVLSPEQLLFAFCAGLKVRKFPTTAIKTVKNILLSAYFLCRSERNVFWCFGKNCVCGWMQEAVNSWNSREPPPCYRLHPYASVRDTACFERHVSSLFWLFMSLTDWHQNEFTSVCSEMFRNHLMKTGEGINIKEHLEGSDDSAECTPYYYLFLKMRSLHLAVR